MARNKYDVDETLETKFDMKQIKRLFSYVGRYRKKLIMTIMLMLFSSALGMVIPVLMQRVMDIYIPNHDKKGILLMAALAALIILATAYILRIKIKWTSQIGQGIIHELRRELFIHLEELPFSYYDSRPHGKIQVRIVNYVNNISDLLSNGIVNTITDCCSLFFILGFMFYYSVPLTLICMCGLPILLAIVLFVKKKQRRGWQLASNKQSNLNAYIAESINGVRVTQAFVREDKNLGIFNNLSGSYRKAWMSVIKYNFMIGPTVQFISILATAAVYWVGIHWIMGGNDIISVGALTALTIYISQFWNPINTLASFYNSLLTAISYLERIFTEAIEHEDIVGLSIGTRPDCLPDETLDLLSELNKKKPVTVELGLQTIHERTAAFIRRGYKLSCFEDALEKLQERKLETVVHTILGLPGETTEDILETMRYLNAHHIDGIKLQLLHVLKHTDLADYYGQTGFHILSEDEYVDLVIHCLEVLSPDITIHRLTGDGPSDLLIAPLWSLKKRSVLNHIHHELKVRDTWQGRLFTE